MKRETALLLVLTVCFSLVIGAGYYFAKETGMIKSEVCEEDGK